MVGKRRSRSHVGPRLTKAAEEIDLRGEPDEGSNNQAVFSAQAHVIDGYYPDDECHYLGVDLDDEKFLSSMTGSVQYVLAQHGLMYNSFRTDRFEGYQDHTKPIEHDYIFHVVDLTWLPERWRS